MTELLQRVLAYVLSAFVNTRTINQNRPRVISSNPGETARRNHQIGESSLQAAFRVIFAKADQLIRKNESGLYLEPYIDPKKGSQLSQAREYRDRVYALSLAFLVAEESSQGPMKEDYWQRLFAETANIANREKFPDWGAMGNNSNELRFLSIAELGAAISIVYDWFYEKMNRSQKLVVTDAIWKQFVPSALVVHGLREHPKTGKKEVTWWVQPTKPTNWNIVSNSSILLTLVSLGRNDNIPLNNLFEATYESLRRGTESFFGPDGDVIEGIGYWLYAINYFILAADTLEIGISDGPKNFSERIFGSIDLSRRLQKTTNFYMGSISRNGMAFGHGDNSVIGSRPAAFHWFHRRFTDPPALAYLKGKIPERLSLNEAFRLVLFYSGEGKEQDLNQLPTVNHFRNARVVTLRTNWTSDDAMFVGIKGGDNQNPHTHIDLGTFVFQARLIRWFTELGAGNYNLPGYFSQRENYYAHAYNYYRVRAEGQNTLVLNPSEHPGQHHLADATIEQVDKRKLHVVVKLDRAYRNYVTSAYRGAAIVEQGKALMIKDSLGTMQSGVKGIDYRWIAHSPHVRSARFLTEAKRRAIVLYRGGDFTGEKLLMYVQEDGLEFVGNGESPLLPANYLKDYWAGTPGYDRQYQNTVFKKIMIQGDFTSAFTATVVMVPLEPDEPEKIPIFQDKRLNLLPPSW